MYELVELYHLVEKLHAAAIRVHGEVEAGTVVQRWKLYANVSSEGAG